MTTSQHITHIAYARDADTTYTRDAKGRSAWEWVKALANAFSLAVTMSRDSERRRAEIEHLNRCSDAELAAKGISRDRIVHHVYRDLFAF